MILLTHVLHWSVNLISTIKRLMGLSTRASYCLARGLATDLASFDNIIHEAKDWNCTIWPMVMCIAFPNNYRQQPKTPEFVFCDITFLICEHELCHLQTEQ